MLGHRGCRLAVTYPEIARDAGAKPSSGRLSRSGQEQGLDIVPEIMIPSGLAIEEGAGGQ